MVRNYDVMAISSGRAQVTDKLIPGHFGPRTHLKCQVWSNLVKARTNTTIHFHRECFRGVIWVPDVGKEALEELMILINLLHISRTFVQVENPRRLLHNRQQKYHNLHHSRAPLPSSLTKKWIDPLETQYKVVYGIMRAKTERVGCR